MSREIASRRGTNNHQTFPSHATFAMPEKEASEADAEFRSEFWLAALPLLFVFWVAVAALVFD